MIKDETKLNNPVWNSLKEAHKEFAIDGGNICFYHPEYCPFGGFDNDSGVEDQIDEYSNLTPKFYVVGSKPKFNKGIQLTNELVCDQMILENPIGMDVDEEVIQLDKNYKQELFDLVNKVQPGYFRPKTSDLGSYFGIFKNDKLVAVTGERMKMDDYTEVSAIVTHPDYTGKGYAKQLIVFTTNLIFARNEIPYLHVAESNIGAINLYRKLGFITRRKMSFWTFLRVADLAVGGGPTTLF